MVVSTMAILMIASMFFMLNFSRKAIKEEALENAGQTLDGTVERIDNIILSIEQATGNTYYNIRPYLNQPDKIRIYCHKLVEVSPYIASCAIAFKPGYYEDREDFITYAQRVESNSDSSDKPIVQEDSYEAGPYTEQAWYTEPMTSGKPYWMNAQVDNQTDKTPFITFCLPIPDNNNQPIGVIAVNVSLNLFSRIVLETKPSPNTYCTLLDKDGSYIVHPDSNKLLHDIINTETNQATAMNDIAKAMVSGETGYKPFRMDNNDYYIFYKPFQRSAVPGRSSEKLEWSVGIIYPEDDIFGDYNRLLYYVLGIAIIGLLLLFVLSGTIIHRQLLPLRLLTKSAQHIAEGNYNEVIPDSHQYDEIGRLQNHFQQMQQSLATNIGELEELSVTLDKRGKELHDAYEQAQRAERLKTVFLHNMTDQMLGPANVISTNVNTLCNLEEDAEQKDTKQLVDDIQKQGKTIAELLNNLLNLSEEETGKEAVHD
jgi:methyl-accepting chemotaxis protein/sigma-B regulation protein RsbU (phosphoserine phosphatase)